VTAADLPREIRNKKLLVVEGASDVGFFVKLLEKIRIAGVYVLGIDGARTFNERLPRLPKMRGFSKITHLAVVRDRDQDDAFKSVANILKRKMGFSDVPANNAEFATGSPRIGVFIMPGETVAGRMLEDLCLKTVENDPAMQCVNDFACCVSELQTPPRNLAKAKAQVFKAQAFLAAQPETAGSVGLGAKKGYWNFDAACLAELKGFLGHLR